MLFREKLRELREAAGLTQEGLARAGGTSVGNIRNYEQGIRLPSFPAAVRLAATLGVELAVLAACDDVRGEQEAEEVPKPAKKRGK